MPRGRPLEPLTLTDPLFIEKVRAIVGLYLNPPEAAMVLCVDEKSQIQALNRTQPALPMGLGYVEGYTHDRACHSSSVRTTGVASSAHVCLLQGPDDTALENVSFSSLTGH